jgi:enoyl-CoA hydratase/carnithine racemase
MSFASREKAIISQWEVGVGMVAGGGPMARLPELIGRNRALEVLLSSEDIRADQAAAYGYINRAMPDADLDAFVEALATRIAKFDKWAIANTKPFGEKSCQATQRKSPSKRRSRRILWMSFQAKYDSMCLMAGRSH